MSQSDDTIDFAARQSEESRASFDDGEVGRFRGYLLRYASLQLRDSGAVEDVVQETMLAAIESSAPFQGKSSLKTWLTGILKRKIVDYVRRHSRERPLVDERDDDEGDATAAIDALFADDGHWRAFPKHWNDPGAAFENKQFWQVFETCARALPEKTAQVFTMREVLDLSTDEICKELNISETNCWVMLHRARQSLRKCLEMKWFGK